MSSDLLFILPGTYFDTGFEAGATYCLQVLRCEPALGTAAHEAYTRSVYDRVQNDNARDTCIPPTNASA